MTPAAFIAKWRDSTLSERAGAQPYFLDLCEMLGVPKPTDRDNYCFERGATRTGAGRGWADVWMRHRFAWENKAPGGDLGAALKQLMTYALALDNPPLLIVSDRRIIHVHTHFTGTPSETHTILLEDIGTPDNLQKLRWVFTDVEKYRPSKTVVEVTAEAAGRFADVARSLQTRGHDPHQVAHFLIQCLFCMFAEDVGLLPEKLFERVVKRSTDSLGRLSDRLGELFATMRKGGELHLQDIPYFNGGLFEVINPVPLDAKEIDALLDAAKMDWSNIEPSIFGTLFERGLNPAMRSQLGAQYTDPGTINKLIEPLIIRPLQAEWATAFASISANMEKYHRGGRGSQIALDEAKKAFFAFLSHLEKFRVLDPACGSGNFLYLSLRALKDLEHRAYLDAEVQGLQRELHMVTSPANVLGIEINPYAAELARVTVWIGEIQWMIRHGYPYRDNPVLAPLDHIECRDAIMNPDGSEPAWPTCDVITGNPPFLGDKKMRGGLGDEYVERLRTLYKGRVPGGADLVTYWFEKARSQIASARTRAAGLVATNSIRGGASREVLDQIVASTPIFSAWSDEDWINDGAAVRVSLVSFCQRDLLMGAALDGNAVANITGDLSGPLIGDAGCDLTKAAALRTNIGRAFIGTQKGGGFDITGTLARDWLLRPNPNGRANKEVVRPWVNGIDLVRRSTDTWIVDFGCNMTEMDAALYELPFKHVEQHVKPVRLEVKRDAHRKYWWLHAEDRPGMRTAIAGLGRYIATARVAKYRIFRWVPENTIADSAAVAIARNDDPSLGILSSRFHMLWSLRLGTSLEDRPRYTPTSCFETFPFPSGLTPDLAPETYSNTHAAEVASAAMTLNELRDRWLCPAEWTDRIPEVIPGYPDRIVAKPGHERDLAKRTLTNLYNERPTWLDNAHKALDKAVADAYGWTDYTPEMSDDEILSRLLALNLERTGAARSSQAGAIDEAQRCHEGGGQNLTIASA